MKMNDIIAVIKDLACSQGFYGMLYRDIMELKENDCEGYADLSNALEAKDFKDSVDLVLFFEC